MSPKYYLAVDLAKGKDLTAVTIMDPKTKKIIAILHGESARVFIELSGEVERLESRIKDLKQENKSLAYEADEALDDMRCKEAALEEMMLECEAYREEIRGLQPPEHPQITRHWEVEACRKAQEKARNG